MWLLAAPAPATQHWRKEHPKPKYLILYFRESCKIKTIPLAWQRRILIFSRAGNKVKIYIYSALFAMFYPLIKYFQHGVKRARLFWLFFLLFFFIKDTVK
jgi:hypothetical protein